MLIDLPVRLTKDLEVVDRNNQILVPCIAWKGDTFHLARQQQVGQLIVDKLNGRGGLVGSAPMGSIPAVEGVKVEESAVFDGNKGIVEAGNKDNAVVEGAEVVFEEVKKRRGMPKGGWPRRRQKG